MNRRLLLMSRNATVWVFLSALVLFVTLHRDGYSQSRGNTISGVVVDDTKKPLVGATVVIEGKKAHAITDAKGRYQITASQGDILQFNFLGMLPQKITVGEKKVINVQMVTDAVGVNEVVVVGYGVQNRRDVTTAISSVTPDNLQDMPLFDINQAMSGQAAGVNVISVLPVRRVEVQIFRFVV